MTELTPAPLPYHVAYSGLVRNKLEELISGAQAAGRGRELLEALTKLDARLRIYPQFSEPLRKLALEPMEMWIGVVPPLVVRYFLDEQRRIVLVSVPLKTLPRSGF